MEGLYQQKIPIASSGMEPTTFRLVVQCLNQLCNHVLPPPLSLAEMKVKREKSRGGREEMGKPELFTF